MLTPTMRAQLKRDLILLTVAFLMLVALYAVSWRADPGRTQVTVMLYLAAGLLEVGGIATVGLDLRETRRKGRAYGKRSRTTTVQPESRTLIITGGEPPELPEPPEVDELPGLEDRLSARLDELEERIAVDTWRLAGLIDAERFKLRAWLGFAGLLLGVVVGTVGNIISAT